MSIVSKPRGSKNEHFVMDNIIAKEFLKLLKLKENGIFLLKKLSLLEIVTKKD